MASNFVDEEGLEDGMSLCDRESAEVEDTV
jgi:hypothetical protein